MPCDGCLDDIADLMGGCNDIYQLKTYITLALERLCGTRCAGQLVTPGLDPVANPAAATAEGFPNGLPDCDCALLVLLDTNDALYVSADDGISWLPVPGTKHNITTSDPTINDDENAGYSVSSRWINTATGNEWVCVDASAGAAVWALTTGGGTASSLVLIDSGKLSSAAASIDITGIPAVYQDLILVVRGRHDFAGASPIAVRFNGDNGANYAENYTTVSSSGTETHTNQHNQNQIAPAYSNTQPSSTTGYFGHLVLEILSYADPGISRGGWFTSSLFDSAAALNRGEGSFAWENLANAINQITLFPLSGGNFVAGTTWHLYGRGSAA